MSHCLRDLLEPEPPRDPAAGMREALALHEAGVAIERARLRRLGLSEAAVEARLWAWLAEAPPTGAGAPGLRRRALG